MQNKIDRKSFLLLTSASTIGILGCGGGNNGGTRKIVSSDGVVQLEHDVSLLPAGVSITINATELSSAVAPSEQLLSTGYDIELTFATASRTKSRGRQATPGGNFTLSVKAPEGAWGDGDLIYLQGVPEWGTAFLHGTFNPQSGNVQAQLPYDALVAASPASSEEKYILRFRLGMARLIENSRGGPVAPKFYTYAGGVWQDDGWSGLKSLDGRRIAVIVPGTFTRRSKARDAEGVGFKHNAVFKSLALYLSSIKQGTDLSTSKPDKSPFDSIIAFEYDDIKASPDESGNVLGTALRKMLDQGAQIYVFAHSQGGLVARWAIEKGGAFDASMLVMFGVPNQGIPFDLVSTVQYIQDKVYSFNLDGCPLSDRNGLSCTLHSRSIAMDAMKTKSTLDTSASSLLFHLQSSLLKKLNTPPAFPTTCAYYSISGHFEPSEAFVDPDDDWLNAFASYVQIRTFRDQSDGTVMIKSSTGADIDWSKFSRGLISKVTWEGQSHSYLPKILQSRELSATVEQWIRNECLTASTSVEIK